jgi:kumamolisin
MKSPFWAVWFGLSVLAFSSCNSEEEKSKYPEGCMPVSRRASFIANAMTQSLAFEAASHIPKAARAFSDQGRFSRSETLPIAVSLAFNHEDELDRRLLEVYTPGMVAYRRFVTPEEFRERYAPTQDQIEQAQAFLQGHGIHGLKVNANGYLIEGQASLSAIRSAFGTEIRQYKDSTGKMVFAPSSEPKLPAGVGIRAVHGLHNMTRLVSHAQFKPASSVSAQLGTGPSGGFSPQDIRQAYRIPSQVTGAGQTIAIVALDGYNPSDIANYQRFFGLRATPIENIFIDGATGAMGSEAGETTLDIELVSAIAPGANRILVYQAPNNGTSILNLYSRIANDNRAQVVTTSWGGSESLQSTSFLVAESGILKQMALQGQTVFAAAGDAGAYSDQSRLSVIDPASQPFVVGVGGTRLYSTSGSYQNETTWNNGSPSMGAGGGGVSSLWAQPGWQSGVNTTANRGSGSMRNVPDVALNSDPMTGYSIYFSGRWVTIGGTSAAAPIWAGFTALVNEQRQSNGLRQVGFLNPILYRLGQSARYVADFNDIRDGSTNLYYPAVQGYDNATGWGSFNGQGLFEDLSTDSSDTSSAVGC